MNKSIFILFILTLLSFQKDNHVKTTMLFNEHLEVLRGNVRQLVEISHGHSIRSEFKSSSIATTKFDTEGNSIEGQIEVVGEKKYKIIYFYKYYENRRKIETIANSIGNDKEVYKYDKEGRINQSQFYSQKGAWHGKVLYKYDSTGRVIEQDFNDGQINLKVKYKYDNKRNLIEEESFPENDGHGIKFLYEYKSFDAKGNWLKKIRIGQPSFSTIKGFKPTDTIERKITYY